MIIIKTRRTAYGKSGGGGGLAGGVTQYALVDSGVGVACVTDHQTMRVVVGRHHDAVTRQHLTPVLQPSTHAPTPFHLPPFPSLLRSIGPLPFPLSP